MEHALHRVRPEVVLLYAVDPQVDTVKRFLQRLYGLVQYALTHRGGVVELSRLAASTAHNEPAVRSGLAFLEQQGCISISDLGGGRMALHEEGKPATELSKTRERLQAELRETAAYRAYYRRAVADRLVVVVGR
jgi:hypothetical protein